MCLCVTGIKTWIHIQTPHQSGKKEEIVHLNHVQCMNTNLSERKACVSLFESVSVFLFFSWPPFYSFCVLFSQETKRGAQVWFPVGSYLRTWWPVPHQSQRTQTQVTHSSLLLFFTVIHLELVYLAITNDMLFPHNLLTSFLQFLSGIFLGEKLGGKTFCSAPLFWPPTAGVAQQDQINAQLVRSSCVTSAFSNLYLFNLCFLLPLVVLPRLL